MTIQNNNRKALKSGIWYTVANFVVRSIGFLTTPLFTRLLSHDEFGLYSNYNAWLNTLMVFVTLNLSSTFISARFDFEDDFDGYVSSMLVFSSVISLIWLGVINVFASAFTSFTGIESKYLNLIIFHLLFFAATDLYQTRERYLFEYKRSVLVSLLLAFGTSFLSVLLVINTENKLNGRIIGNTIPYIVIGIIVYIILLKRGKKVSVTYWKYALPICLPFIPHILSLTLLSSMDKQMITKICGASDNALYSVAYSCGAVITMLITSLNSAYAPWLGEQLQKNNYTMIKKVAKKYMLAFTFMAFGVMLITPEILLIMGGHSYLKALSVMPPVSAGCICQFLYTMYVNIEQFKKRTLGMAVASVSAAGLNFLLNSIFIPRFGYTAAAYTTLASYLFLLLIHMGLVKHIGYNDIYNTKWVYSILGVVLVYMIGVNYLYVSRPLRYLGIIVYVAVFMTLAFKYRTHIKGFLKRKK